MKRLETGKIYAIDGGFFKARYNEAQARFELWTYQGFSGSVIARTGFDIGEGGTLYHRIFDFETQEHVRFPAGYTVDDVVEVDAAEFPPAGA